MSFMEMLIPAAQAHEKWLVDVSAAAPGAPELFTTVNPLTVGGALAVVALLAVLFANAARFERSALNARLAAAARPLREHAADLLAVATAMTLLWMSAHGALLADNLVSPPGAVGAALLLAQAAIAAALVVSATRAVGAAGLLLLYAAAFFVAPAPDALDYLHYAGIGAFLLAFAPGRRFASGVLPEADTRARAYLALRVTLGVMMLVLAYSKWASPGLHFLLLEAYPKSNPFVLVHALGMTLSREVYVLLLFFAELVAGAAVLSGAATRLVAALLLPVFAVSVVFVGLPEIIGHLPILAALAVLFAYGKTYRAEHENSGPLA